MTKLRKPLFSFDARGRLGKSLSFLKRRGRNIVETSPEPPDAKTLAQLSWRHMFLKAVALWYALSAAEKEAWESEGRLRHMTGYAWFVSQALRPNPGLYLPLQGGTMTGEIKMATNKVSGVPDPVANQDADTKAARNAAIAAALAGSLHCDIYGYDGSNWQTLLVESAAQKNLRVKLYDGANQIRSATVGAALPLTHRGVAAVAAIYGFDGTLMQCPYVTPMDSDNRVVTQRALLTQSALLGFDGSKWDRLRTYGTGVLKVGRAEIDSTTVRKTAAGAAAAGSRKLFWVACSPDAPGAEWVLTDGIAGGGPIKYDHFDPDKHSDHFNFDPPIKFSTGIWIEKFDHMHSLVFCYI